MNVGARARVHTVLSTARGQSRPDLRGAVHDLGALQIGAGQEDPQLPAHLARRAEVEGPKVGAKGHVVHPLVHRHKNLVLGRLHALRRRGDREVQIRMGRCVSSVPCTPAPSTGTSSPPAPSSGTLTSIVVPSGSAGVAPSVLVGCLADRERYDRKGFSLFLRSK